jgi:Mce-associated membrane protein
VSQAPPVGIEDPDQTVLAPATGGSTGGSTVRALVAAVLLVLLVLGVVACGYLVYRLNHLNDDPLNPLSDAPAVPADTQRKQAAAVAEQFALRMDQVDSTKFDAYVKSVNGMLTTKAKTKNSEVFEAMKQSYEAAKVKGTGKVLATGLSDIDDDSATVLVAHDASVTTTQGDIEHHYRWSVNLVKVGGSWLVDDFTPVN